MNTFLPSFGEFNNGTHHSDASSSSETSSPNHSTAAHSLVSDEEVILASARPKKRAGRRVFTETRHPVYRGVRRRNKNKWVCEMRVPNNNKSRIWLGTYQTPEMAARAHDVAALTLRGKSACLNFADSAWRLTLPESTDAVDIRRAAMEAAEMFAAEDNNQQRESVNDYQVCSAGVGDGVVIENANNLMREQGMYEEQVPAASGFEEWNDLLMSIADGPIMSAPPSPRDFSDWPHDVEIFDAQVSLWSF